MKIWVCIGAAVVMGLTAWFWRPEPDIASSLRALRLHVPLSKYRVTSWTEGQIKDNSVLEIHGRGGDNEIRITAILFAEAAFENYLEQKTFEMESQFGRRDSPYPGSVSQNTGCPQEFLPAAENLTGPGWSGRLIRAFANSRKLAGVCREDERHYHLWQLILLCTETGTAFDVTLFARPNDMEDLERLKQAECLPGRK